MFRSPFPCSAPVRARPNLGAPLATKGIQPVWLEVTNGEPQEFLLMLPGIDRDYFSPSEVAWQARDLGYPLEPEALRRFDRAHIPIAIPPRSTRSGFV